MDKVRTIIKVTLKEGHNSGENYYSQNTETNSIDYYENNTVKQHFQFSELSPDSKSQKQFVEAHISEWIEQLLHGTSFAVVVLGHEDSGTKYLMKGSNSNPGIVSSIEKRLASLSAEMKITAKMSYIRYAYNEFWDIFSNTAASTQYQSMDSTPSFSNLKSIPIQNLQSLTQIDSIIHTALHSHYSSIISPADPSIWLFTVRVRSSSNQSATLLLTDCITNTPDDLSILHPTTSSSYGTLLHSLNLPTTTLIGCMDGVPSPFSLALLSTLSQSASPLLAVKSETDEEERKVVPVVEVENDIAINLISSSSDSYVQSDDDEPIQPVFETPKKSFKRLLQHSPISSKVYKSTSFSPLSRVRIYNNETRLASLLNGMPLLSPCSRIVTAKARVVRAREEEVAGRLEVALKKYEEAYELLPDNTKLKNKIEEVKQQMAVVQMAKEVHVDQIASEEQLLQILNFAGLNGLEKLKRIGPTKAAKIIKGRDEGMYNSIYDLERIGMSQKAIDTIVKDNVHC